MGVNVLDAWYEIVIMLTAMSHITKWMKPLARFEAQIEKLPLSDELAVLGFTSGCWEWTGKVRKDGYAKIKVDGRTTYAHRFAYQHFLGVFADDLVVDHRCRNRKCVNPEHLQVVTTAQSNLVSFGPGTQQAVKTHCPQGHPYDAENTYLERQSRGVGMARMCKTCIRLRDQVRKAENHRQNNLKRLAKGWKPFKSKYAN